MSTENEFAKLGLCPLLLDAVEQLGYTEPTPVQAQAIPLGLEGRDVLAAAQTGTGKTAAFLLPIFNNMISFWGDRRPKGAKGPYVLILSPTRELATQIAECAQEISKSAKFRVQNVIGGVKYEKQVKGLSQGCDILIATPGRLNDLLKQDACTLKNVRYLVLDEVDRMVDLGFWPSVNAICRQVTGKHQTFLFSATITPSVEVKSDLLMNDPARVEVSFKGQTADTVHEYLCPVSFRQKLSLLTALLNEQGPERVLVFAPTKMETDSCARRLESDGLKVDSIHAGKPQGKRDKALRDFRSGKIDVLVATDVLARGIDISDVRYVVNLTVPNPPEDYVHRIGRTGRAGEAGRAYTFMSPDQMLQMREIEYFSKQLLEIYDVEGFEYDQDRLMPNPKRTAKRAVRRGGGRRLGFRR